MVAFRAYLSAKGVTINQTPTTHDVSQESVDEKNCLGLVAREPSFFGVTFQEVRGMLFDGNFVLASPETW